MLEKIDYTTLLLDLASDDAQVRRNATRRLGRKGNLEAIAPLLQALKDPKRPVRESAARSLGRIGHPSVIPGLTASLRDRSARVSAAAVTSLARIGGKEAIESLCVALSDARATVRNQAIFELSQRIGLESLPALCRLLPAAPPTQRLAAQNALRVLLGEARATAPRLVLRLQGLTGEQRWLCLVVFRTEMSGLFSPLRDLRKFCEQAGAQDATLREGAHAVLDFMTLIRPAERDYASESRTLLRAASGGALDARADTLLRAADITEVAPSYEPQPASRLARFLRWFRGEPFKSSESS
jgi:hypothetical protein